MTKSRIESIDCKRMWWLTALAGLAVGMSAVLAPPTANAAVRPGWGAPGSFLGRYHLMPEQVSAPPAQAAGIFTAAVSAANRLVAVAETPTAGQLTVFMRTVKKTEPPVPSGILSVVSPAASYVVYLTELTTSGPRRNAIVNGGSFLGPSIGTFSGTTRRQGQMIATLSARQLGTLEARFVRFSANPEP